MLAANGDIPPKVLDVFAGGGAIPLEASRLGCDATAIELNPVAHLIELCTLDYPQRFGLPLADDVQRWGTWLIDRAKDEVGHLYPEIDEEGGAQGTLEATAGHQRVPIAYLWTRTVKCPNPTGPTHWVPLVRQTWLVKKTNRYVALRLVADRINMAITYEVVEASTREGLGFDPEKEARGGGATCPLCGAAISEEYARQFGRTDRYGDALMAVGSLPREGRGKTYVGSQQGEQLLPTAGAIDDVLASLVGQGFSPPEATIPPTGNAGLATGRVFLYGMRVFSDLFTRRQLAMLLTLCKLVREAHDAMLEHGVEPERAKAATTYLALLVDRMASFHSSLCTWISQTERAANALARQAFLMNWDYAESNPFSGSGGDLRMHLDGVVKVVQHCAAAGRPVSVVRASATELPFEDSEFDAVITDPPYYDNVGYADLSDFFYVWLKRSIEHIYPEHLAAELTPKRGEIIAAPYRQGGKDAARLTYERLMSSAFAEAKRVLKRDGVFVCVYAHQTTAGWATLIEAVRNSGFVVVEAWPLDTEMPTRVRAQGTASLASSIFLVARPRTESSIGDWAHEVRPELQAIVADRVATLANLGISGTDLVISVVGAGMRAYTRFARVEKPNGEELAPDEYLEEVEREVAETVLARIFRVDRSGLGRVDQETQFYVMGRFEFGIALGPWDELNTLARGTGVELKKFTLGDDALVEFGKKRSEARLRDYSERGEAIEVGRGTIDHLHRVLWLAENAPDRVKEYLDAARPDADRLRLVAHALSRPGLDTTAAQSQEAEACERLLASFKRLVEDNLFVASA